METNIHKLLRDGIEPIRLKAEGGDPQMQYAYARIHDILQPEKGSVRLMEEYYTKAMNAGIADARAALALAYRDGDFGEVDLDHYHEELRKALADGSEKARRQLLRDRINGNYGVGYEPFEVYEEIEKYIADTEAKGEEADAAYYHLLGDAASNLGRTGDAISNYEIAVEKGDSEALFWLAIYSYCDLEWNVVDRDGFEKMMSKGQEQNVAGCFLAGFMEISDEAYDALDDKDKKAVNERLYRELSKAGELGESLGPLYLGECYEEGRFGFGQDFAKAFSCYARGAELRNPFCYDNMSRMILDDLTAPEGYDEAFAYECSYRALLLQSDDALEVVRRGYLNGFLTHHAAAIEQIYLPLYEQRLADSFDDHEIDEDDWGMDPDIDLDFQTCNECVEGAKERVRNQEKEWEVADIVRKFIASARRIIESGVMTDDLYGLSTELEDYIFDHPRLKLGFKELQYDLLKSLTADEEELAAIKELDSEIEALKSAIALADAGRLSEIPQSGFLKKDPVEWTKEWEDHIDEADKMAYMNLEGVPRGMGFCFSFWPERASALAKFGISWRNPHMMNPRVIFD